jgi:signal transduction histidine kinase
LKAPLPANELERVKALHDYEILDTAPEQDFDDITLLASHICETPIALISLVDDNRQWFKSKVGTAETETPRDIAFCAHGILQPDVFVVEDALADQRFVTNPLVTGNAKLRFYAGSPLINSEGHALGMLCVNDRVPRKLSVEQKSALQALARQVVAQFELRQNFKRLAETISQREQAEIKLKQRTEELAQSNRILSGVIEERKRSEHERQMMETQLRQSQKLESIGQLAAGIAHEINTPMQYVGDNTRYVKDSFAAIGKALQCFEDLHAASKANAVTQELLARHEGVLVATDLKYLLEQIPSALNETLEGVERVSKIVNAMKEFSHPGGKEKSPANLNKAIESTVVVARNEWHYVAEMKLDLEPDLPLVPCFLGEFNQCILSLVVNAAHAIGDVVTNQAGTKGLITVQTRTVNGSVEVRVTDTGTGIPEAARSKIFEPFFTTKEVGKGTGQGLSIVYANIVKKHGGTVRFETESGKGTSFILCLPLASVGNSLAGR